MSASSLDRERLRALFAAIDDPNCAATLPADDPELLRVARFHRLSPMLSVAGAGRLPAVLAEPFHRDRIRSAARNLVLRTVAEECVSALGSADIPCMVLKGLAYELTAYPQPGARPTSDVDLFVPLERRARALRIMDELRFEPRAAAPGFDDPEYHEIAWNRGPVEVDLHFGLAPFARYRIDYDAVWAESRLLPFGGAVVRVLGPPQAALFHAIHMAIDHYEVPGIYLLDFARLLRDVPDRRTLEMAAREWRCQRPLETALALTAAFFPAAGAASRPGFVARRIAEGFGSLQRLPRSRQLIRKALHFDRLSDLVRYVAVQSRRNLVEQLERRIRKRTPRERLGL